VAFESKRKVKIRRGSGLLGFASKGRNAKTGVAVNNGRIKAKCVSSMAVIACLATKGRGGLVRS